MKLGSAPSKRCGVVFHVCPPGCGECLVLASESVLTAVIVP